MRHARRLGGFGNADSLAHMGHGDGCHHVDSGGGECLDLRSMERLGLIGRQGRVDLVAVARGSDSAIHDDGKVGRRMGSREVQAPRPPRVR